MLINLAKNANFDGDPELALPAALSVSEGIRGRRALALRVGPNPFPTSTRIQFELATAASVDLAVFDVAGRAVRRLERSSLKLRYRVGAAVVGDPPD